MIEISKLNEVYIKVSSTDRGIEEELKEHFTFHVPGYKFMPAFKKGMWDGKLRLYNPRTKQIYAGLFKEIVRFAEDREYDVSYTNEFTDTSFSYTESVHFLNSLNLPLQPRDYQIDAFTSAIRSRRRVLLSPTGSGKSFIIYLISRYYAKKTLFIVPTTGLVHQLASDFKSYGYNLDCHVITSGKEKDTDCLYTISTWQSIFRMPPEWFNQFEVVICDECVHPNTKITMSDNTKKQIKDIKIGDFVKTYNEKTKTIENKKVLKVHQNISITEDFYEIETATGIKLQITGNHKVLLKNGVWKKVEELKVGDIINSIE